MATYGPTLIGSLQEIAGALPSQAVFNLPRRDMVGVWLEELFLTYCVGQGTFSQDMRQINLMMDVYDFNGNWIGSQQGVHLSETSIPDLFASPPAPPGPFDQPVQVPTIPSTEWTKGLWTFADGSSVRAAGPARSHLVPFQDGSFLFMVATGQVLSKGTGRFKGMAGIKNATGTAFVPPGVLQGGHFPAPGLKFTARTIETFRIARAEDWHPVPPPQPQESAGSQPRGARKRNEAGPGTGH